MKEVSNEKQIFDHHIAGYFSIPAEAVQLALHIRRCFRLFIATVTTILLLTVGISAKNLILMFLAITFILEADNVLVILFR